MKKTAKQMFEELGYKFLEYNNYDNFHRLEFNKDTPLERGVKHQTIWFDLIHKELYIHNDIVLEELQAINKQVEELGWGKGEKNEN